MMKKASVFVLVIGCVLIAFASQVANPASAAPEMQLTAFPTPTPGPDGRIMYIVQEGDTLWRIAAVTGMSLEELRGMNNLGTSEVIVPGQKIILGLGGPALQPPTLGPPPTATSELPTPTPGTGTGMVCVLLFADLNGDGIRQEEEPSIPGGAISVNDRLGTFQLTAETPAGGISANLFPDPDELGYTCFEELEKGDYNITVAVPEGYNPTTVLNRALVLIPGDEDFLDFGAQPNAETLAGSALIPQSGEGNSPLLAIAGLALLLVGIWLGISLFLKRK
jgi:LPXTG-motif cell wall-anchored protein